MVRWEAGKWYGGRQGISIAFGVTVSCLPLIAMCQHCNVPLKTHCSGFTYLQRLLETLLQLLPCISRAYCLLTSDGQFVHCL